ncbi:MAG: FHA domain-containing protein [Deltaproteobacteria bacterium]|nr:FHA domain-containing protein [Deltaproteobacteria bacterium]
MAQWHVMIEDRVVEKFWIQEGDKVHIGRGKTADVNLDNTAVSRRHAIMEMKNGEFILTDLKSTNGTRVNGKKINAPTRVTSSDRIEIGKFRLVMRQGSHDTFPPYAMVRSLDNELEALPEMMTDYEGTVFVAPRRLTVIEGKAAPKQFSLRGKSSFTLGKDESCDVQISGRLVANIHCYIMVRGDKHYLINKAGGKGTTVNGKKAGPEEKLRGGDTIGIGGCRIRFE